MLCVETLCPGACCAGISSPGDDNRKNQRRNLRAPEEDSILPASGTIHHGTIATHGEPAPQREREETDKDFKSGAWLLLREVWQDE